MSTRRRRHFSTSAARRRTDWARTWQHQTLTGATDVSVIDLLTDYKADGGTQQGTTIARTRLRLAFTSSPSAGDVWAFGLAKGQIADVGLNIAGAPDPEGDPYGDWLLWDYLTADSDGHFWPGGGNVHLYDLKAMRKLEGLDEAYTFTLQRISTSAALEVSIACSTLLMLP